MSGSPAPLTGSGPTSQWIAAAAPLPPLDGPADTAERLLLLLHYGIAWQDGWVAAHRGTYWDKILPDRVIAATYRYPTLRRWWQDVASELQSRPRNPAERLELEELLRAPGPVLEVLREEAEPLILRVRIIADAVRDTRQPARTEEPA